jgi:hypothetical protein
LRCCGRNWAPCTCWASTVSLEPWPVLFSEILWGGYILDILEDCVAPVCIANYAVILKLIKSSQCFVTACNMKVFPSHTPFNQILCKVWCSLSNRASAYI